MACYMRVSGKDFDVDSYFQKHPVEAAAVYRRGEPEFKTKPDGPKREYSGFNIFISDAERKELGKQIQEAISFLEDSDNCREIKLLLSYPGVEGCILDFSIDLEDMSEYPIQYYSFPFQLLRLAGNLKLGLEVSLYGAAFSHDRKDAD